MNVNVLQQKKWFYQISSVQSDVKGRKCFQYKKMLKDSNDSIELQIIGKKII